MILAVSTGEYNECKCDVALYIENYCQQWTCLTLENEDKIIENGTYECTEDYQGQYCNAWHGDVDSEWEFELSSCKCINQSYDMCLEWTCTERDMPKQYVFVPHDGINAGLLHAILWPLLFAYWFAGGAIALCANQAEYCPFGFCSFAVFVGICIACGGIGFFMIHLLVIVGVVIILGFIACNSV